MERPRRGGFHPVHVEVDRVRDELVEDRFDRAEMALDVADDRVGAKLRGRRQERARPLAVVLDPRTGEPRFAFSSEATRGNPLSAVSRLLPAA